MFDSVDGMCSKCYQPIQKVNKDDDNKDTDFPEIRTIKNEIRWSKKEQLYWLLGGITFIFLFLIL